MSVLIAGTVALDDLKTPFGERKNVLGGSAVHASVSAGFFSPVKLLSIVGRDFPKRHLDFLSSRRIDLKGLKISKGKTFHWEGFYEYDMNQAHSVRTDLNVLTLFDHKLPRGYEKCEYVFLANIDPEIQLRIISQLKKPKLIVADTMNYWISNKRRALEKVIKKVDIMLLNDMEARQLTGSPNLIRAASDVLKAGAKYVIIKKGEHGALLFSKKSHFSAPSYPQEKLTDPTGAGDSFAGGFIGYLAKSGDLSGRNMRKAVIVGTVMASFNVEDFSLDALRRLKYRDIIGRFKKIKKYSHFDGI
ncbi:MAG: PfkB family carbohydrate kinase [Candidatus Saganbacteria bacterium]|nr:PfkB family carbohydrate kinase [Candidatus Saganbacteria bacterium]